MIPRPMNIVGIFKYVFKQLKTITNSLNYDRSHLALNSADPKTEAARGQATPQLLTLHSQKMNKEFEYLPKCFLLPPILDSQGDAAQQSRIGSAVSRK